MLEYSVLMSVYYKEKPEYLAQAIDSMLMQTVPPHEFVIICDGPLTPALDALLAEYEAGNKELFRIIRFEKNRGLGLALRDGVTLCRCDLIARMDSDDISMPDRIEKQLAVLKENPEISIVGGQIAEFNNTPEQIVSYRIVPQYHEEILHFMRSRNAMNHVTVLFRKDAVLDAGNYESLLGYEDYYLWVRMLKMGKRFRNLSDICCYVRVGDQMFRRRGGMAYFRYAMIMEKHLLRLKLINRRQYVQNLAVRFIGAVLIPDSFRGFFQKALMRRKHYVAEKS